MASPDRGSFAIPYYHDYISPALARELLAKARAVNAVPGPKPEFHDARLTRPARARRLEHRSSKLPASAADARASGLGWRNSHSERPASAHHTSSGA